jgi:hypothetical protein
VGDGFGRVRSPSQEKASPVSGVSHRGDLDGELKPVSRAQGRHGSIIRIRTPAVTPKTIRNPLDRSVCYPVPASSRHLRRIEPPEALCCNSTDMSLA